MENPHFSSDKFTLLKAPLLSIYFFMLVAGYYFLKPLSRSLYITYLGSDNLPYVWIATTLTLTIIIPLFHWKVTQVKPLNIIFTLILSLVVLLTLFKFLLVAPSVYSAFIFYVLVDVYSVLIIENFWSLTNSNYEEEKGKSWYGFIASGGMLGGLSGSAATSWLIKKLKYTTVDLIVIAIFIFLLSLLVVLLLNKLELIRTIFKESEKVINTNELFKKLFSNPYVRWVAYILIAAQLIEPLVEYQLMSMVELNFTVLDDRTKYVSDIFAYVSFFGISINMIILPIVHRIAGLSAGLMLQPLLIGAGAIFFFIFQNLKAVSALKIIDRGLAYSSGRASREILFIPFDATEIYKIKAWIDIYGYRFFRIFGSFILLLFTKWFIIADPKLFLSLLILFICFVWLMIIMKIKLYIKKEVSNRSEVINL